MSADDLERFAAEARFRGFASPGAYANVNRLVQDTAGAELYDVMRDSSGETRVVTGRVKWFDPGKGFGFVVAEDGGPDILLHANVLRNFGQSSVADGAGIEVSVTETARGVQAVAVHRIDPPEVQTPPLPDLARPDLPPAEELPLEPARVKWFDKAKGFGFANVFGRSEDVFLHVEVLRRSGLADLQPGEAVSLRIVEGKRGRMAQQVASWDAALKEGR